MMKFSVVSLAALLLICVSLGESRDYVLEVNSENLMTNSIFVSKNSAVSRYTAQITYQGKGDETCAWNFCITRSFRGIVTELGDDTGATVDRVLTSQEGCMEVSIGNYTNEDDDDDSYGGSTRTELFAWNAQGEFYLNGELTSGNCAVSAKVTGSECQEKGEFGLSCDGVDAFSIPTGTERVDPENPLVFVGLESTYDGKRLGQLQMVFEVEDAESDGVGAPGEVLGKVRLLLNGIPTLDDYDFDVDLKAPRTELSIFAARRDSTYFYSVQADEDVLVSVTPDIQDCQYGGTYGPNCSITANVLVSEDVGHTLTFDPATESYCYDGMCYFYLVQKTWEVTVMPTVEGDEIVILYKTNNFPAIADFDVAMPASTSFIPAALVTESTAQFAVYSFSGRPFTILLGETAPPPPPPPPTPPVDDELPWAWIGVSIALGVISLALITGFAIYTCKPPAAYESIE